MKQKFLFGLLLICCFITHAQNIDPKNIMGDWIITSGWFGKDTIIMERINAKIHKTFATKLIFKEKDNLLENIYNPEKLGFCGFGLLQFNIGSSWKINDNEIFFDIEGTHIAVDNFKYKMSYTIISFSKEKIVLKKGKVILFEEKKFSEK